MEGMWNERIVASGIYYYSSENITDSHLGFRTAVTFDEPYEQSDDFGVKKIWGLERYVPTKLDLFYITKTDCMVGIRKEIKCWDL